MLGAIQDVALLAEGVDRNTWLLLGLVALYCVALLAEGVDRNNARCIWSISADVALLAEGVDRNTLVTPRACCPLVALLAEGVDRNEPCLHGYMGGAGRPPRGGRG